MFSMEKCPFLDFNPRTREGCDVRYKNGKEWRQYFNPRTREGCDIISNPTKTGETDFNPRTREGCDSG